jgi:hypothetical protein
MPAVRSLRIGGSPGEPEGKPGKGERCEVGQHVTGVGDQGQGAGNQPADHLGQHEAAGQQHHPEDLALALVRHRRGMPVARVVAMVMIIMGVRVGHG